MLIAALPNVPVPIRGRDKKETVIKEKRLRFSRATNYILFWPPSRVLVCFSVPFLLKKFGRVNDLHEPPFSFYNTFGISVTFSGTKVFLSAILKTSMPTLIFILFYQVLNRGLVCF